MRDSAFRTAREVASENDKRVTLLKKEFEVEKERCIETANRESQAQFGQAKAKMVSDLMNAKKEIAKMKYAESERSEYNQELIADIKVSRTFNPLASDVEFNLCYSTYDPIIVH